MCFLRRLGCAFPSTDVWSLVSPTRGLVLSDPWALTVMLFQVFAGPQEIWPEYVLYIDGCVGQLSLHTPVISELQPWAVKAEINSER